MRPAVLATLTLSALWVVFFWRVITPVAADRVVLIGGDFYGQYTADSAYISERLWQGQIPLWNPYSAAGAPFAALLEVGVWYPLRWLSVLAAGPGGWGVEALLREVAFRYWLVSLMTYGFFRLVARRPSAALIGSILFTYGGYLTGYPMPQVSVLDSAMWMPLALSGAHMAGASARHRLRGSLLAGAALAISILAGHPQTTMTITYLTLAYLVFVARQNGVRWRAIAGMAGLLLATFGGLAAVLLLPAAQMATLATRLAEYSITEKGAGYALGDLFQVLWPGIFVGMWSPLYPGVAGLLLALGAMLRPNPARTFWAVVLALGLLLVVGDRLGWFQFLYVLAPGFDLFRQQERAAVVVAFAFAALASDGVDGLLAARDLTPGPSPLGGEGSRRIFGWLVGGHVAVAWLAALIVVIGGMAQRALPLDDTANSTVFVALMSAAVGGWWIFTGRGRSRFAGVAMAAILALDLFSVGLRTANFVPDIPQNRPQEPRAKRMIVRGGINWHVDGAAGLNGYGTYFRVPDVYPSSASILELQSIYDLRALPVDRFWEALAVRYVTLPDTVAPPASTPVNLLATQTNLLGEFYQLYEIKDPRPLAWLVYSARPAGSHAEALGMMADPSINLRETAITTGGGSLDLPGEKLDGDIIDTQMVTPERIEIKLTTPKKALLTVAVPNYPGWRATIDGQPAPIVDTYAGLIGVPIPSGGRPTVVLEFVPMIQIVGSAISLIVLAAGAAISVWEWRDFLTPRPPHPRKRDEGRR